MKESNDSSPSVWTPKNSTRKQQKKNLSFRKKSTEVVNSEF